MGTQTQKQAKRASQLRSKQGVEDRKRPAFHERRYKISKKIIVTKDIHRGFTLVYGLRRGKIRRCSTTFWKALNFENRWGGYVAERPELKDLIKDKFLVPADEDEQKETLQDKIRTITDNLTSQLYWSIWPTANCNLACDYCGQKHSNATLSREHCDMVVQCIHRRLKVHGFKRFHISWFGAEPLLGLSVMRYLTPRFHTIAKELGIEYDARLITNGTLLTKHVGQEVVNQMSVRWIEITLDGPREIHDRRRVTVQGKGTYDRIIHNLTDFFENCTSPKKARVTLRCNVDRRNKDAAWQLVDQLATCGFQNEVDFIGFASVSPWGRAPGHRHRFKHQREYAKINLELAKYALSKGFKTSYLPFGSPPGCTVADLDSSANVAPDGRLYRCTEIPLVPKYEEQREYRWWDQGSLEQLLRRNEEDITFSSDWYEELSQGRWPCAKCKFFGVCGCECPNHHREGFNTCPPFIFNFEKRMRLYSRHKLPVPAGAKKERPWGLSAAMSRIVRWGGGHGKTSEATEQA